MINLVKDAHLYIDAVYTILCQKTSSWTLVIECLVGFGTRIRGRPGLRRPLSKTSRSTSLLLTSLFVLLLALLWLSNSYSYQSLENPFSFYTALPTTNGENGVLGLSAAKCSAC